MTMNGTGPGMDGKPTKYKSVSVMPDDDTINFTHVHRRREGPGIHDRLQAEEVSTRAPT